MVGDVDATATRVSIQVIREDTIIEVAVMGTFLPLGFRERFIAVRLTGEICIIDGLAAVVNRLAIVEIAFQIQLIFRCGIIYHVGVEFSPGI